MSRHPSAECGLLIALLLAAASAPAAAQDRAGAELGRSGAEQGRAAYLSADFPAAASAFDAVLADPAATREEALEAHRHLATLRFVLGEPVVAERHVRASIALDDDAVAVEGSPAEIEGLFTSAREAREGRDALELASEPSAIATTVTARLAPWARDLEGSLSLACRSVEGAGAWTTRGRAASIQLEVPALEHDARCAAALAPSEGATPWLRAESRIAARGGEGEPSASAAGGGDDALVWGLGMGGAALAVAAAVVIAVVVTSGSQDGATFAPTVSVAGW